MCCCRYSWVTSSRFMGPILVEANRSEDDVANFSVKVENDMPTLDEISISKAVEPTDLARIPEALHADAAALTENITYALYTNRDDASAHTDAYAELFEIHDGVGVLSNMPNGTYYIIEWSIPDDARNAGMSLSDKVATLLVADGKAEVPQLTDMIASKRMYVKKVDAETKDPIAGAVFDIYESSEQIDGKEVGAGYLCSTNETDAQGIAVSSSNLLAGRSYFVQERYDSLPGDYNGNGVGSDTTWNGWIELALSHTEEDAFVVENEKNNETGSIEVKKSSNTGASLEGAVFSVYDSSDRLIAQMTTGEDGIARIDGIPVGPCSVRETTALPLHAFTSDGSVAPLFEGVVTPNACWHVNDGEPVENYQGYMRAVKSSAAPEMTEALADTYSLAGAVYSIYPIEDGIASLTALPVVMTTDENGHSNVVAVPIGSYKVVETTEPANFDTPQDKREFFVDVTLNNAEEGDAAVFESVDEPASALMGDLVVEKRAAETYATYDGSPQGTTSMGNTEFAIEYTSDVAQSYEEALTSEKTMRWVVATGADGRATFDEESIIAEKSDEIYRDASGQAVLPVGTIVVREITPPVGYTLGIAPTTAYVFNGTSGKFEELTIGGDIIEWDGAPTFTAANDIYRADISFHKSDAFDAEKKMAHIPFLLSLLDEDGEPLEQHLIFTDEIGNYTSAIGSIDPVNRNHKMIPGDVLYGKVDADAEPIDSRIWFSGSNFEVPPSAEKGALIYGDYELREFATEATAHYQNLMPVRFSVRGDNDKSWIEIDGHVVEDGNLTDAVGNIENHAIHITSTELLDAQTGAHTAGDGSLNAIESVAYADATAGERYMFETYAYDADTKEPIERTFVDLDDETVTVQAGGAYTLECVDASGHVNIDVSFEGYDVADKKIGLMTLVYHNGYLADIHNEEITDDAEAISFARIGTSAVDADSSRRIGNSDGYIDIIDTVAYENLVPGCEYVASGVLMDKASGSELRDAQGNAVTAQTTFTPADRNGSVEVHFSFDMEYNTPFTAVAFEQILVNGECVAKHEDIEDSAQTVTYPRAVTTARDAETGTFQGNAENDRVHIIDRIEYQNIVPGAEYEARGTLYVLDENGVKTPVPSGAAAKMFVAEGANGFIEVEFDVSASDVRGHRVLVGETIWSEGDIIAEHDDAAFEDQTLSYPFIHTEAFDAASSAHIGNGEKETQLVDVIYMEGLKPGENYRIDGTIMVRDKAGNAVATAITASEEFAAESSIEEHRLSFAIPADLPQDDVVVYERLSSSDGKNLLATHEDAQDEKQSVHYPTIRTVAISPDGGTHVGSNINNKVVDTVAYENLVPGYAYEVVGMLAYKETGEIVTEPDSAEPIVSSTVFSPSEPNGSVEVPFEIHGADVVGKTLVVLEQLFVVPADNTPIANKTLVATHCDLDDAQQSMFYPRIRTVARDRDTASHVGSSVETTQLIDTVLYENLVPGLEYEVQGVLMDRDTGEIVTAGDGDDVHPVIAATRFVAEDGEGSVEVTFEEMDPEATKNRTFVAYEKLLLHGFVMAEHEELDDADQSVSYPQIETCAADSKTKLHEGYIDALATGWEGETVTVTDTVEYSHLVAGREYKVIGKLVDKYELADGENDEAAKLNAKRTAVAQGETVFVPEGESGEIEVTFEMSKTDAYGCVLVAFETLMDANGNIVASHEDIDDEAQTVSYPKIGTTARDAKTGSRAGSNSEISIVDTVEYEGLLEGHAYIVSGTLMDKNTGEAVISEAGEKIIGETEFVAGENGQGEVEVTFEAAASKEFLEGKTFVAFERIEEAATEDEPGNDIDDGSDENAQPDDGNEQPDGDNDETASHVVIAMHEDIDDESQTIRYPKIRTHAENSDGSKLVPFERSASIIDTVIYENLVPGVEYTLDGVMMNKMEERELIASGEAVTATKTFVADKDSGEEKIEFSFDGTATETCVAVAFETLSAGGAEVAEHKDIEDEDQSVHVAGVADELVETGEISATFDGIVQVIMIAAVVGGVLAVAAGVRRRKR